MSQIPTQREIPEGCLACEKKACSTPAEDSVPAAAGTPAAAVKPRIGSYKRHLLICTGPRCTQDGAAQALFDSLGDKFKAAGINDGALRVKRSRVGCFAACKGGPIMCVQPDGTWYYDVTEANMDRIIQQHLVGGTVVPELVFHQGPGLCDADGAA